MSQSDRARDGAEASSPPGGPARRGGWIGLPGGPDRLPADARAEFEAAQARLEARRGRLLCEVNVAVYEHEAVPWVSFAADAVLQPDSGDDLIAGAVARAGDSLARWR